MPRTLRLARLAPGCIALLMAGAACALDLHLEVEGLQDNMRIDKRFVLRGRAYNADPEGEAVQTNGLRAFYFTHGNRSYHNAPMPIGDTTNTWWQGGRNSEFATNAWNSGNWWIHDTAAWRAANGLPTNAIGQSFPPYVLAKIMGDLSTTDDDKPQYGDNFTIVMCGKLVVPTEMDYRFNGGGDDVLNIYLDGRCVHTSAHSANRPSVRLVPDTYNFIAEFGENGGHQYYSFGVPAGCTLVANPPDEFPFFGRTLEAKRWFAERRDGRLTLRIRQGQDGTGADLGDLSYFNGQSYEGYGTVDTSPSPQPDHYRLIMAGYWYCPATTNYSFLCGADDRFLLALSNASPDDPGSDPWTIPAIVSSELGTGATIDLDEGWHPIRMEFGEGGGNAQWNIFYGATGSGAWALFNTAACRSTEDRAYEWFDLANDRAQAPETQDLFAVDLSGMVGEAIDLRVKAVGYDLSEVTQVYTNLTVVERNGTMLLLR